MLAAGFIGQFGKRLADFLVARSRIRRRRKSSASSLETGHGRTPEEGIGPPSPEETGGLPTVGDSNSTTPEVQDGDSRDQSTAGLDSETAKVLKKLAKAEVKRLNKSDS